MVSYSNKEFDVLLCSGCINILTPKNQSAYLRLKILL